MNWIELLAATVSASLIGSLHCVGMCGPFAIIATHGRSNSEGSAYPKIISYHLGRLTTYFVLGTLAGLTGTLINGAGQTLGWSHTAARVVGASMIIMGLVRLIGMLRMRSQSVSHSAWLQRWTRSIVVIGKRVRPTSAFQRAYVIGFVTTWLPCGWLYLFALAASSLGSVAGANALMFAFWLGTLPLLSALSIGSESIRHRLTRDGFVSSALRRSLSRVSLQGMAAVLMIAFGVYTYTLRSQIHLDSLDANYRNGVLTQASIHALSDQPLPCCSHPTPSDRAKTRGDEP